MKKIVLFILLMIPFLGFAQIGIGTSNPRVTLEIVANPDGEIPPGVMTPKLTGDELKNDDKKYTENQTGTLIYVTSAVTTSSTKTANVTSAGYYIFNGETWKKLGLSENIFFCSATNTGTLTNGTSASDVTSVISFKTNGQNYKAKNAYSTKVTGLFATIDSIDEKKGELVYKITGTPSSTGNANFNINMNGETCILQREVN